ncbi:MAG: YhcH/YjgK/YiaL family protein [Verrucomicrobiota bacterium]
MAIIGNLEAVKAQCVNHAGIRAALAHVGKCLDPVTPEHAAIMGLEQGGDGRAELGDGVVALTSFAPTKTNERGRWETHVHNIDVQVIIAGEEIMELADVAEMTFKEDCVAARDAIFYQPYAGGSRLRAKAGFVAVFFPEDAHRASMSPDGKLTPVRKIVVKVPVAVGG